MDILEKITNHKRNSLVNTKKQVSISALEKSMYFQRETFSLSAALCDESKTGIISEFKRKSPSKDVINEHSNLVDVVSQYQRAKVSGVSVLTNQFFFGGTNQDLILARANINCPVLRKEFIIDEYQVIESKAIGADVILLIAAILTKEEIAAFSKLAHGLGLETLMEIHDESELSKLSDYIDIIGVNNRNLKTFKVDIKNSLDLAQLIPNDKVKISESGISETSKLKILKDAGYNGFLIGEHFMKQADPGQACITFSQSYQSKL